MEGVERERGLEGCEKVERREERKTMMKRESEKLPKL